MQRFRLSSSFIQFTSPSEATNSDNESDNQPEQRLTSNAEVIRVGNLLDQVKRFKKKEFLYWNYLIFRHHLLLLIKLLWKQLLIYFEN
jgi:hypothetical protein